MTRRERLERKAEKRRDWAGSAAAKSDAAHDRVNAIADGIPFGQPILVGHHSERHARRDQARMESGMSAAIELGRKADRHAAAADGIDRALATSIFSDDEDAVEQLHAKVERLEAQRAEMKAANAKYRSEHKAELAAMGPYERSQAIPYPSYSLTNLGATIRNAKQRADQLEREKAMVAAGDRGHGRTMESRYRGTCADCGGEIDRGDSIIWYRLTREATHAECPTEEAS
jgi:hypothetical protein